MLMPVNYFFFRAEHRCSLTSNHQLPCLRRGRRCSVQSDAGQDRPQAAGQIRLQALPPRRLPHHEWRQEPALLQTCWDEGGCCWWDTWGTYFFLLIFALIFFSLWFFVRFIFKCRLGERLKRIKETAHRPFTENVISNSKQVITILQSTVT